MKGNILQVENMNYIRNQFGKELWVQVYGHKELYGADGLFWVGLIPNEDIEESLKTIMIFHSHPLMKKGVIFL